MKAKLFIIISIIMFFSSCTMLNYSRIEIRNDEIKKEKNVHLKGWHNRTVEWRTPLSSLSRHFYKKTNQKGVSVYYVYEVLKFNITSMPINDTIYLITNNEVLPI